MPLSPQLAGLPQRSSGAICFKGLVAVPKGAILVEKDVRYLLELSATSVLNGRLAHAV